MTRTTEKKEEESDQIGSRSPAENVSFVVSKLIIGKMRIADSEI